MGVGIPPLSPGPTTNALGVSMETPVGPGVKLGKAPPKRLNCEHYLAWPNLSPGPMAMTQWGEPVGPGVKYRVNYS